MKTELKVFTYSVIELERECDILGKQDFFINNYRYLVYINVKPNGDVSSNGYYRKWTQ